MDVKGVMEKLPHRYPFLLVDKVIKVNWVKPDAKDYVGASISALKNVTINEPFFQGHFPGLPVMPGVLIVEAFAQTSALLAGHSPNPNGEKWNFFIMGIREAKFRKTVVPGDTLVMTCTVVKDRQSIFVFSCQGHVDGHLVAEAEIMAKRF